MFDVGGRNTKIIIQEQMTAYLASSSTEARHSLRKCSRYGTDGIGEERRSSQSSLELR